MQTGGGTILPAPPVEQFTEPGGQGAGALANTSAAQASGSCGVGWQEKGAGRGRSRVLPGVSIQGPTPSLPSLWTMGEVVTFLMKSRRTFWSSQLKVVKSASFPVGRSPS